MIRNMDRMNDNSRLNSATHPMVTLAIDEHHGRIYARVELQWGSAHFVRARSRLSAPGRPFGGRNQSGAGDSAGIFGPGRSSFRAVPRQKLRLVWDKSLSRGTKIRYSCSVFITRRFVPPMSNDRSEFWRDGLGFSELFDQPSTVTGQNCSAPRPIDCGRFSWAIRTPPTPASSNWLSSRTLTTRRLHPSHRGTASSCYRYSVMSTPRCPPWPPWGSVTVSVVFPCRPRVARRSRWPSSPRPTAYSSS